MAITFSASVKTKTPSKKKLKNWLVAIALSEKRKIKNLAFNFCSDKELLQINQGFLKHNTYTDIITFDYTEKKTISGEIFVSIDRVKENAKKFKEPFPQELRRIIIHGVLHLCGYGDKSVAAKKIMRKKEDEALSHFKN